MLSFKFDNLTGKEVQMNYDMSNLTALQIMCWW